MQCRPAEPAPLRPRAPAQPPSSRYKAPPSGSWQFPTLKTDKSGASIPLNNRNAPTPDPLKNPIRAIDRVCCCKSTLSTCILRTCGVGRATRLAGGADPALKGTAVRPSVSSASAFRATSYSMGKAHCSSRQWTRSRPPFPRRNRRVNRIAASGLEPLSLYNGPALIRASQSRA